MQASSLYVGSWQTAPRGETRESRPLTVLFRDCHSVTEGQHGSVGRQRHVVVFPLDGAESEPAMRSERDKIRIMLILDRTW